MITYEDAIVKLRNDKNYINRIYDSYLDGNILSNMVRFSNSNEFLETLSIIKHYTIGKHLLEIGAGTGFAASSFARASYTVTAIEPDSSSIVGCKAMAETAKISKNSVNVIRSVGEKLPFRESKFDIVYFRQSFHHISDYSACLSEIHRVLKSNGILIAVREHVVSNNRQLKKFLKKHPLHQLCGGENAYTLKQYKKIFLKNNFKMLKIIGPFESEINYYPYKVFDIIQIGLNRAHLKGFISIFKNKIINNDIFEKMFLFILNKCLKMPGRNYSFIAIKDAH